MNVTINKNYFKQTILSDNNDICLKFKKNFAKEINAFVASLYSVYEDYKTLDKHSLEDLQKMWVSAYIYKAMQDTTTAFSIFVRGFILPSGNSMRQFHESVAMAMLLSNKKLRYSEEFIKNPKDFRVSNVFRLIKKNLSSFDINQRSWKAFCDNKDFYHNFSHSSALSIASLANFETKQNFVTFGAFYDKGKEKEYLKEMNHMIQSVTILRNIIIGIKSQLGLGNHLN